MATIIYPKGTPCQINEPDHIKTDEDIGISFKSMRPDPNGIQQRERIVIGVEMFNMKCAQPWRGSHAITTVQAKEIGRWLTKRAREADRAEMWDRVRQILRLRR